MNSFSLASASPELGGKCRVCEAIGACLRIQVRTVKSCNLCLDSSLYPVLFYSSIPDRFLRSFKNDGQVFSALCKNRFFHLCSRLPLSAANSATFPDKRGQLTINILSVFTHFYCIALLLEKWFACFPTSGDGFLYDSFLYFCFFYMKTIILSSLASASPELGGKCRSCEAIGACLRTQVRTSWQNRNNSAVILERWHSYIKKRNIKNRLL